MMHSDSFVGITTKEGATVLILVLMDDALRPFNDTFN